MSVFRATSHALRPAGRNAPARITSNARLVALLGVLAAIGSVLRITTLGIAGVETVFIVVILGARVLGARLGFVLGVTTIAVSSLILGGFGPWTLFQLIGVGLVGLGAGALPRLRGWRELTMLAIYGVTVAYLFGAFMNLWFWPFLVGANTSISFVPGAPLNENIARFGLFTLITSTLTWDTIRAFTTALGIALVGRFVLGALRRTTNR
jgi:energy-coupling factor transport system ATP-binding protein